jgi:hypothetical protein
MSKYLQTSFAAMTHLAEGLCFNALLTLKVENSLICLVGTHIASVQDGRTIIHSFICLFFLYFNMLTQQLQEQITESEQV